MFVRNANAKQFKKKRFGLVVDEFSDQRTSAGRLLRGRLIRISNRENG